MQDVARLWNYIHKDLKGSAVLFGPWEGPNGDGTVYKPDTTHLGEKPGKQLAWYQGIKTSASQKDFFEWCEEYAPWDLANNIDRLRSFARWKWPDTVQVYTPRYTEFANVPDLVKAWAAEERFKTDRPKTLVLFGATRTGKTEWARSLGKHTITYQTDDLLIITTGRHWYMSGNFNIDVFDSGAEYGVCDDMEWTAFWEHHYKQFFGAQREFDVNDKYCKKVHVRWGKPLIWLNNWSIFETLSRAKMSPAAQEWFRENIVEVCVNNSPMY